jgi:hypothetical protein
MSAPRPRRLPVAVRRSRRRCSRRGRHGYIPRGFWLEDRTLLAALAADPLAGLATPIALGTPTTGTLGANETIFYQINPSVAGRLIAQLHAPGGVTCLTLMDAQGHTLLTSDGQSIDNPDDLIDIHVLAGTDYLELENPGEAVSFTLSTSLTPSTAPFQSTVVGDGVFPSTGFSVVEGDFRGDGRIDLAVSSDNGVSVLLGNGDGTFQPPVLVTGASGALVTGDFRGDGRTDLAGPAGDGVEVLLGNGDGTFQSPARYEFGTYVDRVVAGDFNGDGRTDLAVANGYETAENNSGNTLWVLLGNGDGTFQPPVSTALSFNPNSLVAGDFTGDTRTDLVVAHSRTFDFLGDPIPGSAFVSLLMCKADGTLQPLASTALSFTPGALLSGDFNGDGRTDLAVAASEYIDSNGRPVTGTQGVSVLFGNGHGTFQTPVSTLLPFVPNALVAGDFNGDGRTDLAAPAGDGVSVLPGNGDGTFQSPMTTVLSFPPSSLVAGDFNGDGRNDLAACEQFSAKLFPDNPDYLPTNGAVSILPGKGDGTFQTQATIALTSGPVSVVTGDFNGDGRTDMAVAMSGGSVSVLLGNGDGTFLAPITYALPSAPTALVAGDFNGDGRIDLAVALSGDVVSVLLGNGDGTFQAPVTYTLTGSPNSIVAGDFNSDGRTDLAIADENGVSVLLGNGDGTFRVPVSYDAGTLPSSLVAGDFTGDGRTDLAVANADAFQYFGDPIPVAYPIPRSGFVSVLLGNGDGTFQAPVSCVVGPGPFSLVAGDFRGDGHTDLAVANQLRANEGGAGHPNVRLVFTGVFVLLGNGDGTFQTAVSVKANAGSLVAGDFTGDGRTDLATPGAGDGVSVSLSNGKGSFQTPVTYALPFSPTALVAGDFNGDGRPDLAGVSSNSPGVSVLQAIGGGDFTKPGQLATVRYTTPLVADLNADGTDDVLVIDADAKILYRQGVPGEPGNFLPPVTVNPNDLARDIAYVSTPLGPVIAAVDAHDDQVSFYAYRAGRFVALGSIGTGLFPAQLLSGDLIGDGESDLVVRNAGDGTLTVIPEGVLASFLGGSGGSLPVSTLTAGAGVSDVALVDTAGRGVPDIVVTSKLTGLVSILPNLGGGAFGPPMPYRASAGLAAVDTSSGSAVVTSQELTSGVVAGAFTSGEPTDLLTVNPASNTLGLLAGLGAGRFANPLTIPTRQPAQVVRVADFNGDGLPDLAVLGKDTVSIELGDGKGGFSAPFTYNAGLDPTGLTVADLGHDGNLDLLIGNAYGDVLTLAGNGDGTFRPLLDRGNAVALAVADLTGRGTKDVIYADQGLDQVVVDYGGGQKTQVGANSGLLAPGAVALADLSGDGTPDLIVANSGGNNVLVYPGLGNGQFGPALLGSNGRRGFSTGTDPVGVTVANLNGRPDLVVADKGSNDVTILLNQATADGGFTFVPGPRLNLKTATQQGLGPVSTALVPSATGGPESLAVSLSGSNEVWVIPGVGGGFFNDGNPTIFPTGLNPGPLFVGNFDGRADLVSVNAGSNDLTLISGIDSPDVTTRTISSGGVDPVTGFAFDSGDGFDSLVVGNNEDGVLALLQGGSDGLSLTSTLTPPDVPSPTSLVFSALTGGQVQFFAATAGHEEAIPLAINLAVESLTPPTPPAPPTVAHPVPLSESSLSLAGTLLVLSVQTPGGEAEPAAVESVATTAAALLVGPAPSAGQSLGAQNGGAASQYDDFEVPADPAEGNAEADTKTTDRPSRATAIWQRYLLGIDDAQESERPNDRRNPPPAPGDGPSAMVFPGRAGSPVPETATYPRRSDIAAAVDRFLRALGVMDADSAEATATVQEVSGQLAPGEPGPYAAAGVVPVVPAPARPEAGSLPTAHDLAQKERIDVSLSMAVAAVGASRFFSSIRPRRRPRFGDRGVMEHEFTVGGTSPETQR